MTQYIEKSALSSEIEKKVKYEETWMEKQGYTGYHQGLRDAYRNILSFLDTLEVVDPYEQRVQYDSIKSGIQAQAETYSFNIESELYNQQTTKEGQKLWRKEIEQAFVIGGEAGVELAKDPRYKENLEVKDVDLEKEIQDHIKECLDIKFPTTDIELIKKDVAYTARKFFELGVNKSQKVNKDGI